VAVVGVELPHHHRRVALVVVVVVVGCIWRILSRPLMEGGKEMEATELD
jgi:hypothetical protein